MTDSPAHVVIRGGGPGHPNVGHAFGKLFEHRQLAIAVVSLIGIATHIALRFDPHTSESARQLPLFIVLGGSLPLLIELLVKMLRHQFGSDLLAGISIVTSILLHQYLAGALVVLMLSGGEALEAFAVDRASSALRAMAARLPSLAHCKRGERIVDLTLSDIAPNDLVIVYPHEICPVDGTVVDGHGSMNESFLTGEPFGIAKAPGAAVLCGAVNGTAMLTIRATGLAADSRYERIINVMRASEQQAPRLRRLGDQLGAWYTPLAVAIGLAAWWISGSAMRFLAVMVVATPCPLLIAIPVAIIGAISLAARRGIIIKKAAVLEQADRCRTMIFDKTGTLTCGSPALDGMVTHPSFDSDFVLSLAASLEQYSRHPLAEAVKGAAERRHVALLEVAELDEAPGAGLSGIVDGHFVQITGRNKLARQNPQAFAQLPPVSEGLECIVLIDRNYAATMRFMDQPKVGSHSFVGHLAARHQINDLILLSGDRKAEVQRLGKEFGINRVYFEQSPEQKLQLMRDETMRAPTIYVGDGINDAPALTAATIGVAIGPHCDVAAEAAGVVIFDTSLEKVDEFLHISRRMRRIALQSAVGGMALSAVGMLLAATGLLPPVAGALAQELIDLWAVANALRAAIRPRMLSDLHTGA